LHGNLKTATIPVGPNYETMEVQGKSNFCTDCGPCEGGCRVPLAVQSCSRVLHSKSLPPQRISSHVSSRTVPLANLSAGTFQWRCSNSSYSNCNVTVLFLHYEVYFLHTVLLNTFTVFSLNFTCFRLKSCSDDNKQ